MSNQTNFIDLNTIYTEKIEKNDWVITKISLTEEQVRLEKMQNFRNYFMVAGLKANFEYVKLFRKKDGIWMSDTPMERNSNKRFIQNANGDVLIFGLGLGLIIFPLLEKESVKSIKVVELNQEIIDLVCPYIWAKDTHNKFSVIQGDAYEHHKIDNKKYDCVYGDIWRDISTDNYEEMKTLTKNWKNRINRSNPNSFIDHWMKDFLKGEIRKEQRERSFWQGHFNIF